MLTVVVGAFLIWSIGRPFLVVVSDRIRKPVQPATKTGVSIVVPCHDAEGRLPSLVAQLLAQTYRPLEIVLVENNSTDDTWGVLLDLAGDHPEVKIHAVDTDPAEYLASVAMAPECIGFTDVPVSLVRLTVSDAVGRSAERCRCTCIAAV